MCDMTHSYVLHWHILGGERSGQSWNHNAKRIHMCHMTHSHVWHDSFICATWHILGGKRSGQSWNHNAKCIHMCDMTHSYVWHDSFTCATLAYSRWRAEWLKLKSQRQTHSYVWHDSFTRVTWLVLGGERSGQIEIVAQSTFMGVTRLFHMCVMTQAHVWRDLFTRVTWLILGGERSGQSWNHNAKRMSHVTYINETNESCHVHRWVICRDSFPRLQTSHVPWLIHTCNMTRSRWRAEWPKLKSQHKAPAAECTEFVAMSKLAGLSRSGGRVGGGGGLSRLGHRPRN